MRGEKTIDLGFTISVSQGGDYVSADTVTVRAPGFRRADIHDTMVAWVSKASINFTKLRAGLPVSDQPIDDDEALKSIDDADQDWMQMVAMGLEVDQYAGFASYVRKVLTNSKLASVGDVDAKLTDEAWEAIYDQGGMEAVRRIESAFVGFFFESLMSTKRHGNGKSPFSASPTKARSTSKKPATTPGLKSSD